MVVNVAASERWRLDEVTDETVNTRRATLEKGGAACLTEENDQKGEREGDCLIDKTLQGNPDKTSIKR